MENIKQQYPNAVIIDVTSNGTDEFARLSPFYSAGEIPVPGMPGTTGLCVEGIWQGLKVFENADLDKSYFQKSRFHLKRTVDKYGKVRGHFYKGELLNYLEARKKIYIPAYRYFLETYFDNLITKLRDIANKKVLVLLDYNTNDSIYISKPLSHAAIVKAAILNDYTLLEKNDSNPDTPAQGSLF